MEVLSHHCGKLVSVLKLRTRHSSRFDEKKKKRKRKNYLTGRWYTHGPRPVEVNVGEPVREHLDHVGVHPALVDDHDHVRRGHRTLVDLLRDEKEVEPGLNTSHVIKI